jgi:hypothetical protein
MNCSPPEKIVVVFKTAYSLWGSEQSLVGMNSGDLVEIGAPPQTFKSSELLGLSEPFDGVQSSAAGVWWTQ